MDSHKDKSENPVVEVQTADLSRRQIIRGLAAVPVVMTLSNGAAAATQSQLECRQIPPADDDKMCMDTSDTHPPAQPFPSGEPHDEFHDCGPGTALRAKHPVKNKDCIIAVDQHGDYKFWDGTSWDQSHKPVTASCYTSFVPHSTA